MSLTRQNNHHEFHPESLHLPSLNDCIYYSPLTVTADVSVVDAIVLMSQHRTSSTLVVEESQVVGTFTERDLVRLTASGIKLSGVKIAEVMTRQLITLKQSDAQDLFTVVSLLHQHQIRHLPVLDDNDQLVGIITPATIRQALQPANFLKLRYVSELMTTQIVHAPRTATVLNVARLMAEHQVSCVVIEEAAPEQLDLLIPIGIITERDILQFQVLGLDLAQTQVENVMSTPLFCLSPTDSLLVAHEEMQRRHVRRLVVAGEQGELLGIITQTSFLQVLERLEMSAVIAALQQQVEQQTDELRQANEELQNEVRQRQQVEDELRRVSNELERRVAERTIELTQANALLQQEIRDRERAFLRLQQTETNLQQERDFISAILNIVGCLIVVLDRQGRILRFNQTCEAVTNYSFAEVKGKPFWDVFLVPEEKESVKKVFRQIQAGQFPNQHQNYWLTKQGNLRLIAWSNTAICDESGSVEYIIGTGMDLTERQQAESALQTSELQLRALFQGANDAMVIADDQGRYVDANPAAARLFGLSTTEILGRTIVEFAEPGFDFIKAWQEFQASKRETGEFRLLRPDGTIRDVEYGATANFLPHRHLSILRDISDRKRTELALQQHTEQQRLMTVIAQRIRASLNLDEVLNTTVAEVRQFLKADRVFIYRFQADYSGTVIVEAIGEGWTSALDAKVEDTYFMETGGEEYKHGRIQAVTDIYTAGLTQCHCDLLTQFQIKANLAIPIVQEDHLWGLLVINQCSAPRLWQQWEIDFLNQLSTQVSIAIQQSELYQQIQAELIERKQAEEALRKSEAQLKLALEAAQTGIWDWNILDNKITGSENLPAMFGLAGDSLDWTYETFINQIHPQDQEFVSNAIMQAIQGQVTYDIEFRIVLPNSNIRWAASKGQVFYDQTGKAVRMLGVDMDITERKQAEQKIREQAALLDITTDAIVVRNLSHEILFWNRGAECLYGWSAEEAVGKNANELLYKKIKPQLEEVLKTVVEQGEWRGELHQVTKDGAEIIVEGRWTLVRDEAGNPKSILVVNTNITEKKQLEAQFLRAQRLESLGTLASGIAHDLNNILTPILTSSQLLVLKISNLDPKNQQLLKIIENNSKRGADLVKQILTFARGSEGKRLPLQIEHLLSEIKHIAQSTFPKSIIINTNLPTTKLWTVLADATQIHQILMNLCVNARDAMPNGGTLTLSAENILIDDTYAKMHLDAQVGQYVAIAVSDTGMGIPRHLLDRIFDPFFTTKEQGKGTGLGLSTVIGIIKNHGGFIYVSSEISIGTQFHVYLPAGSQKASQEAEALELHNGKGEMILVVDDESAILEIIKTSLEDYNYRTLTASNGIEAIALYSQHQDEISLVLLDMMMPSMDGLTTIRVLQQMNPQVKIIVMSGINATSQLAEVEGINTFLSKPYTINELLQAIEKVNSQ
ncbi:MAG: PAS domain S-box protein [Aulosira sp. ZfuVER01]|nr:PAS domain S-box protein [Aulosira sp. ZfuVER01]MDZ7999150.1 PAS domain S-box protein [Aulosira sp. DedVER01a]MDZ8051126.1 PAS domain S-box protein [Aulosira sp. ZfuCHP01]